MRRKTYSKLISEFREPYSQQLFDIFIKNGIPLDTSTIHGHKHLLKKFEWKQTPNGYNYWYQMWGDLREVNNPKYIKPAPPKIEIPNIVTTSFIDYLVDKLNVKEGQNIEILAISKLPSTTLNEFISRYDSGSGGIYNRSGLKVYTTKPSRAKYIMAHQTHGTHIIFRLTISKGGSRKLSPELKESKELYDEVIS